MKQHTPRKRFGQNFLQDDWIIARIVEQIGPRPGDHLVEIGPGQGALTKPLLQHDIELDVVELDRDLVPRLREFAPSRAGYRVHEQDALRLDLSAIATDGRKLRVVGNLPYNISTPLLFHMLSQLPYIADMHFMLQKEVVERMAAGPGGRDYGRLSVMIQHYCDVASVLDIGPECFHPVPKVDSALVRLVPHATPSAVDADALATVVRQAFSQRRKTLRNTLKGMIDEDGIRACGIDPGLRPEQIDLEGYRRLAGLLPTAE
ncbi:MAG: 16S rRNA (adenine(1518)-N(6)/adenine(1519)-N(6))-dimethyltransferase RsmA [Gammaproteobacteria bacterium]|nr:16S rRNA (adenine(1518)-N(6)/adenine(1519)-N(6))-dimethyltransferase RsmA [Gammaproteobacteria bacterium]